MGIYETILQRRTIRKFTQQSIDRAVLKKLVNAARLAPQGANLQPIKYLVVDDPVLRPQLFDTTKWAAYLTDGAPKEGEQPTAYIIILVDTEIRKNGYDTDAGAAVENLLLTAQGEGLGSCWLGSINRERIRQLLEIPEQFVIHTAVALGYPAETSVSEDENGSIKYYKDEHGVLHVPKRKLDDVVFFNKQKQ